MKQINSATKTPSHKDPQSLEIQHILLCVRQLTDNVFVTNKKLLCFF
jgi:hypothetical protein